MNLLKLALTLALSVSAALAQIYGPSGRLTLTSNTPVMTSDVTGVSTIYYVAYSGNSVILSNGTSLSNAGFASQLSLSLTNANQTSGNIYDIFVFSNSGALTLCTGPAWTSSSSRGTGTGTTQLTTLNGVLVSANAISSCNNGSNSYSLAAQVGVYLGSVYMTSNGETGMQFRPSPMDQGTNNILGLYNAYNRIPIQSMERDGNTSWTYTNQTWEPLDGASSNVKNRISWLDGLQQSFVNATLSIFFYISSPTDGAGVGISLNSTSATPDLVTFTNISPGIRSGGTVTFEPQLGFNYIQAMQNCYVGGTATYYGSPYQALIASLEM